MTETRKEKIARLDKQIAQLDEIIEELAKEIAECEAIVFRNQTLLAQNKRHGMSFEPVCELAN
ncbi:hypothetical protein [uncultured Dokdonia sp.]|uniref:hypothetical protein n=1 Tax=uncultured Dokdonia sp. TaxID=575653 RepID=UPI00260788BF|nr:hypothetical protein [uncultured Dokdonia sp.]